MVGLVGLHSHMQQVTTKLTSYIYKWLQRRANVNKRSSCDGSTALHRYVIGDNSTVVIRLLLQNGASTTIKEGWSRTPIDVARKYNHQEAVLL